MRIGILVVAEHAASFFEVDAGNSVVRPIEIVDDPQELAEREAEIPGSNASFDGIDGARSAIDLDRISPRLNQSRFARRVADAIESGRSRHEFERLIVMAAPRMLGLIREALPDASRNVIAAEIPKDLARLDAEVIRNCMPRETFRPATH